MYGNEYRATDPATVGTHFPLLEMCGRWVSLCGSPEVRIVFTGTRYRLDFSYDAATVFTCPIHCRWGVTFFCLYGCIKISYDVEKETLLLSDYGKYIRADDEIAPRGCSRHG